jgi:hypothetical protein
LAKRHIAVAFRFADGVDVGEPPGGVVQVAESGMLARWDLQAGI